MVKPVSPKTVLETILEWSADRPAWLRDALRRIVVDGTLDKDGIGQLVDLCKFGNGGTRTSIEVRPLQKQHLPASPGAGASVYLGSIAEVEGVNNLAPSQTLRFAEKGLTVVYGNNGAGKSGYARILK